MILNDIGKKYGTDKVTHNYLDKYESILSDKRYESLRILEIGVSRGSSLKMWEDYFTNSEIFGADINSEDIRIKNPKNKIRFDNNRTKLFVCDQEKKEDLLKLPNNLDLIIDDGGHTMFQQQNTLLNIFDKLNDGGIYILEDLHTSLIDFYDGFNYGQTEKNNTLSLLNDLKKGTISKNKNYYIEEKEFLKISKKIDSIEIYSKSKYSITSIIKKK